MMKCYLVGTIHVKPTNESRLNVPVDIALLEGVYPGRISLADWLLYMPVLLFYYIWIFLLDRVKTDEDSAQKILNARNIKYETVDLTMKELLDKYKIFIIITIIWYYTIAYALLYKLYSNIYIDAIIAIIITCTFPLFVLATKNDRDRGLVNRIVELTQDGKNVLVVRGKRHTGWIAKQLKKRGIEYEIA